VAGRRLPHVTHDALAGVAAREVESLRGAVDDEGSTRQRLERGADRVIRIVSWAQARRLRSVSTPLASANDLSLRMPSSLRLSVTLLAE
jgi:hypothetical protein